SPSEYRQIDVPPRIPPDVPEQGLYLDVRLDEVHVQRRILEQSAERAAALLDIDGNGAHSAERAVGRERGCAQVAAGLHEQCYEGVGARRRTLHVRDDVDEPAARDRLLDLGERALECERGLAGGLRRA